MKTMYVDKKERLRAWFTPVRIAMMGAALLVILLAPVLPDFVPGIFVLAPIRTAVLHATVPGMVENVSVKEGETVAPGSPMLRMRNLQLESEAAEAREELSKSTAQATQAALRYRNFGAADQERKRRAEDNRLLADKLTQLSVRSPIGGTVVTPHIQDLVGRSLDEGDLLLQLADTSEMKANVYIPEFSMHEVHAGQQVRMLINGRMTPQTGVLSRISAATVSAEGLVPKEQLEGINPPRYYLGVVVLKNNGEMIPGMSGLAKVQVARRSLAGFCYRFGRDMLERKLW